MKILPRFRLATLLTAGMMAFAASVTAVSAFDMEEDKAAQVKAAREEAAKKKAEAEALAEGAPRTIFDGVYTEEQSERGKKLYTEYCASCHGSRAGGGPAAPGIIGSTMDDRDGSSVYDLFAFMQAAMPPEDPGYLRDREYGDVTAYILQLHGAPAGEVELPYDEDALSNIEIIARPE